MWNGNPGHAKLNFLYNKFDNKNNQVFFILTTRELSVNINDLRALTLAGQPQLYQGSEPPRGTTP